MWPKRLHRRARHRGPHGFAKIAQERHRALTLLVFGGARIAAWTVMGICVGLGLAQVTGFGWAAAMSQSLPFVAMISIYANWATDLDAWTAAFAALVAADAKQVVEEVHVGAPCPHCGLLP